MSQQYRASSQANPTTAVEKKCIYLPFRLGPCVRRRLLILRPIFLLPTTLTPRQHHNPLRAPTDCVDSRANGKIQPDP